MQHGDEEIAAAAADWLKWNVAGLDRAVKVKVDKGRVTLTGKVDWRYQQEAAMNDIRTLWGVVGVSNEITVRPKPNTSPSGTRSWSRWTGRGSIPRRSM